MRSIILAISVILGLSLVGTPAEAQVGIYIGPRYYNPYQVYPRPVVPYAHRYNYHPHYGGHYHGYHGWHGGGHYHHYHGWHHHGGHHHHR